MKTRASVLILFFIASISSLFSIERTDLILPTIPEYQIIKCDLHAHTVFSDGEVWPTLRVREAWENGLDALAITDHIEYTPHDKDIHINLNRSTEIGAAVAPNYLLTFIKGAEITRDMPPGHFNALFIKNVDKLDTKDWHDAIQAAVDQGAFIFWNHPGWRGQQPDGIGKWYEEHTRLFEEGYLHGIEVVNEDEYYPEVHQWCLDKNLTIMGNSDIHGTIASQYSAGPARHRPMTWVLARENTVEAIKDGLINRRTVVYWRNKLIGRTPHLQMIAEKSLEIMPGQLALKSKNNTPLQLVNHSGLEFDLNLSFVESNLSLPTTVTIPPLSTVLIPVGRPEKSQVADKVLLRIQVNNFLDKPNQGLVFERELVVQ
ncbi:MAG: histidinol-phosphatase [Calditrichaeota bacterium]|nr:MAG: histidinol-phosphatase [Calditrichota bacterium]